MRSVPPPVSGGFGFPLGVLTAILVTAGAVAAHATTHPERSVIPLAATAAVVAAITPLRAAAANAAVCWALHTGFVINRYAELTLTRQTVGAAVVLCTVTVTAFLVVATFRTELATERSAGYRDTGVPSAGET